MASREHAGRRALSRSYGALTRRLTPERTRRATVFERWTVGRLPWETLVRLNRALEFVGKLATAFFVALIACTIFGVDVRHSAQDAFNSGHRLQGVLGYAIVFPILGFLALRSVIGFLRWRVQRELWRRDVAELQPTAERLS